jgi:sugar phosphate isomerase/epimerase
MKRREFIATSALATAGAFLLPSCVSKEKMSQAMGIQLYTLKDTIEADVSGTLKALSDIGITELEAWSYNDGTIFGMPYTDFAAQAKDQGMQIISGHYDTGYSTPLQKGTLRNGWERAVEDAKKIGQPYLVIGGLSEEERNTMDNLKRTCELLNKSGEVCRQYGVRFGYHNHSIEFTKLDEKLIYDVMLQELDPNLVAMELDLFWITNGGFDPLAYFKNYPGRFELWHVKDMDKTDRNKNADVGSGSIDFASIFQQAQQAGLKHFFIEQENFDGAALASVKNGVGYLQGILK